MSSPISEQNRITALIKQAEMRSRLHKKNYDYKADWLVNGEIGSSEWLITIPGRAELSRIDFCQPMPDGTFLTEECNFRLLRTVQKWLFHCRIGDITGKAASPTRWSTYFHFTMNLSAWIILHKTTYNPSQYGFMQLRSDAVKTIAEGLSIGGWAEVLLFKERFIAHLCGTLNCPDLQLDKDFDAYNLPEDLIKQSINYFEENNLYVTSGKDSEYEKGLLSREYLSRILGRPALSFNSHNFRLFIRQFEPLLQHDDLLQIGILQRRHHSQNTKTIAEVASRGISAPYFEDLITTLQQFFGNHDRLPNDIPEIEISKKKLTLQHASNLKSPGHTKLIPFDIGFQCLNQAAMWITIYGEAFVSSLEYYIPRFNEINFKYPPCNQSRKKHELFEQNKHLWMTKEAEGLPPQRLVDALNITALQSRAKFNLPPGEASYMMAMEAFYGAAAIIIGMLKPIRNAELCKLKRDCLHHDKSMGGAFIKHETGKTGDLGFNASIERPIPYLAAHAIQLLQVLGSSLQCIWGDESDHADDLFYMPSKGFNQARCKNNKWKLNICTNMFCDLIKIPLDKLGRRWYVRVHEMRKFFLLLVNRHEGDSSKELLRYAAGHAHAEHINSYTDYDISDSEAIRYESECIDDKLIALEKGFISQDSNQGLVALYTRVLSHFKVTSISTIRHSEFLGYIEKVMHQPDFYLTTFTVQLEDYDCTISTIGFAIRLGDAADESYNSR